MALCAFVAIFNAAWRALVVTGDSPEDVEERQATLFFGAGIFLLKFNRAFLSGLVRVLVGRRSAEAGAHVLSNEARVFVVSTILNGVSLACLHLLFFRQQLARITTFHGKNSAISVSIVAGLGLACFAFFCEWLGHFLPIQGRKEKNREYDQLWDPGRIESRFERTLFCASILINSVFVLPVVNEFFWRVFLTSRTPGDLTGSIGVESASGASFLWVAAVSLLFAKIESKSLYPLGTVSSFVWGLVAHQVLITNGIGCAVICSASRQFFFCTFVLLTQKWELWTPRSAKRGRSSVRFD